MIVADSSYISEGVLRDQSLLRNEAIFTADLAIYETLGAIWKHQTLLRRITEGGIYVDFLFELIKTNNLYTAHPDRELMKEAYGLAVRHHSHPHDTVFVAMALDTNLDFKTLDAKQREIFEHEKTQKGPGA